MQVTPRPASTRHLSENEILLSADAPRHSAMCKALSGLPARLTIRGPARSRPPAASARAGSRAPRCIVLTSRALTRPKVAISSRSFIGSHALRRGDEIPLRQCNSGSPPCRCTLRDIGDVLALVRAWRLGPAPLPVEEHHQLLAGRLHAVLDPARASMAIRPCATDRSVAQALASRRVSR